MKDKGEILIDVRDPGYGDFAEGFMGKTGHPTSVCHGPGESHPCPILEGAHCEHLEDAHGVVFQFDLDRPEHRTILARYKKILDSEIPVRVVVEYGQDQVYAELLAGTDVWAREPTAGDLDTFAAEVEAADKSRDVNE